jgi:hypothetical protein
MFFFLFVSNSYKKVRAQKLDFLGKSFVALQGLHLCMERADFLAIK